MVDIAFNVIQMPTGQGRKFPRPGICTGWLNDLTKKISNGETPKVSASCTIELERVVTISSPERRIEVSTVSSKLKNSKSERGGIPPKMIESN